MTYPNEIYSTKEDDTILNFQIVDIPKEDYQQADKVAKEKNGEVYTMINGEGQDIYYFKGVHHFNRIGVCVLIKKEVFEK